jgi:hypothetical protein
MRRLKFGGPVTAVLAVAVGAVLAYAMPAGAALSLQSESPPRASVEIGRTASLQANGAAVFTAVNVVCAPGGFAQLTVAVTQAVGNTIASGRTARNIEPCTGRKQKLEVAVTPTQRPFVRGIAFGQAELQTCANQCGVVRDERTIRIV